jgi:hypothetical protein
VWGWQRLLLLIDRLTPIALTSLQIPGTAEGHKQQDARLLDETGFVITLSMLFQADRAVAEGDVIAAYNVVLSSVGYRTF